MDSNTDTPEETVAALNVKKYGPTGKPVRAIRAYLKDESLKRCDSWLVNGIPAVDREFRDWIVLTPEGHYFHAWTLDQKFYRVGTIEMKTAEEMSWFLKDHIEVEVSECPFAVLARTDGLSPSQKRELIKRASWEEKVKLIDSLPLGERQKAIGCMPLLEKMRFVRSLPREEKLKAIYAQSWKQTVGLMDYLTLDDKESLIKEIDPTFDITSGNVPGSWVAKTKITVTCDNKKFYKVETPDHEIEDDCSSFGHAWFEFLEFSGWQARISVGGSPADPQYVFDSGLGRFVKIPEEVVDLYNDWDMVAYHELKPKERRLDYCPPRETSESYLTPVKAESPEPRAKRIGPMVVKALRFFCFYALAAIALGLHEQSRANRHT